MLSIDFNDFLAVLNLAVPYLVALGIVIVLAVTAMVFSRKKDKAMKYLIRSQALVAMLLILLVLPGMTVCCDRLINRKKTEEKTKTP